MIILDKAAWQTTASSAPGQLTLVFFSAAAPLADKGMRMERGKNMENKGERLYSPIEGLENLHRQSSTPAGTMRAAFSKMLGRIASIAIRDWAYIG